MDCQNELKTTVPQSSGQVTKYIYMQNLMTESQCVDVLNTETFLKGNHMGSKLD